MTNPLSVTGSDDPRRLRALLERATELARTHDLSSVLVGMAGFEGDGDFPDLVNYVVSALRIEDSVFRLTRERAVVLLADTDRARAREVVERVMRDYREDFPSLGHPPVSFGYFEVTPDEAEVAVKDVLPRIFETPLAH